MNDANRIFVGESTPSFVPRGNYYLVTQEAAPFGLGGKGVIPTLTRSADPGAVMQNLFSVNGSLIRSIGQIAAIFTAPIKPFLNNLVRNAQQNNGEEGAGVNDNINYHTETENRNNMEAVHNDNRDNNENDNHASFPTFHQDSIIMDHDGMAMNYYPMQLRLQPPLPPYQAMY